MSFISARVISVVRDDTGPAIADAGPNQSVLCASTVFLEASIIGDDIENHTFEWEQTFGTPVTLINPNTLTPSFVNPQVSDIEFTFFLDRNTPFEDSDTVFISRRPESRPGSFAGAVSTPAPSGVATVQSASTANQGLTNEGAFVTGAANAEPPVRYSAIYTIEDLDRIRQTPSQSYWLMNDLDFTTDRTISRALRTNWDPIGTTENPFTGIFNGNGHTINNLVITNRVKDSGLFGTINGATIENLGVLNASVTGQTSSFYSGILVGVITNISAALIQNCHTSGSIASEGDRAGGFVGHTGTNVGTLFINTYADVTVTGGGTLAGGWAGLFETEAQYTENYGNTTKTAAIVGSAGDTPIAGEVEGRTTAQLNNEANYTGWDFVNRWGILEGLSPATLRTFPGQTVRVGGFCDGQYMIAWDNPVQPVLGLSGPREWTYKGVIAEEKISGGWGFPRFIPHQRNSVLMTPDTAHRISSVWQKSQRGTRDKTVVVLNDGTFTSKNTSPRFGPQGNTAMSSFGGSVISSTTANIVIVIQNPRKISKQIIHDGFSGASSLGTDDLGKVISRFGSTSEAQQRIVTISGGSKSISDTIVITRNNGVSIG